MGLSLKERGATAERLWHRSIKLTESIKAGPSYLTPLPFPVHFAVQAVHYGGALFVFYATVGRVNEAICMQRACVEKSPFVTGRDSKQRNYIQKMHEKFKGGVISYKAGHTIWVTLAETDRH